MSLRFFPRLKLIIGVVRVRKICGKCGSRYVSSLRDKACLMCGMTLIIASGIDNGEGDSSQFLWAQNSLTYSK